MERRIIKKLDEWASKEKRKVLLILGARQVGKTFCINSFAGRFDQYHFVDLSKPEGQVAFENQHSLKEIFRSMPLNKNKEKTGLRSLIFLDEISASPSALRWLHQLNQKNPELFIVASSSRILSIEDIQAGDETSFLETMPLYPYNFSEFLGALGEDSARDAIP